MSIKIMQEVMELAPVEKGTLLVLIALADSADETTRDRDVTDVDSFEVLRDHAGAKPCHALKELACCAGGVVVPELDDLRRDVGWCDAEQRLALTELVTAAQPVQLLGQPFRRLSGIGPVLLAFRHFVAAFFGNDVTEKKKMKPI